MSLLDRSDIDICEDEVLLNTVLDTLIRLKQTQRLFEVLRIFKAKGMKPSVHTYGTLIKAFGSMGKINECRQLWDEMTEGRSMEPNDIVFGCMIDALVVNEELHEALGFFKSWKGKLKANTVMYSSLIKGFAQMRDTAGAMEMYEMMKEEGVKMNTICFNSLIDSCARVGAMDQAAKLLEDMTDLGVDLDLITYSTIIKGYCIKGDLEQALAVFHSMHEHDMHADAIIYNTLLDGCVKHNRFELADRLLTDMGSYGIVPSNFTLMILVKMWGRRHMLDKAFEAVDRYPREHNFRINEHVYTCLISACLANSSVDRGLEVFTRMLNDRSGPPPDGKTYSVLIDGCARANRWREAVALVEQGYGVMGDGTRCRGGVDMEVSALQKLLQAMSRAGAMEEFGMPLMERLRAAKAPVDRRVFTTAMNNVAREASGGGGGYKG